MRGVFPILTGFLLFLPAAACAQSPTDPAHPALPWALGPAIPQGQLISYHTYLPGRYVRDIWVPAQPVVVQAAVALQAQPTGAAASAPRVGESGGALTPTVLRQTYVVPGYSVRETTVGFHIPERWVLDSSYTWRLLPAEFRPR